MKTTVMSVAAEHAATRIIVVEDNPGLLEDLVFQLNHAGFCVRGAIDGRQLDVQMAQEDCEILILDLNLPFESGIEIAKRLHLRCAYGIIMLTARGEIEDKLLGLDSGADIYLVKPIDRRELIGCIKSLQRRINSNTIDSGWKLDLGLRQLKAPDGRQLELTQQDLNTLCLLLKRPGQIFDRTELGKALCIEFLDSPDSRINMVMSRLRMKLSNFDTELRIQTWRNAGYSYVGPNLSR